MAAISHRHAARFGLKVKLVVIAASLEIRRVTKVRDPAAMAEHHEMKVRIEDIWAALDALDAVPEAARTDWYKRLAEAAEAATQVVALDAGVMNRQ